MRVDNFRTSSAYVFTITKSDNYGAEKLERLKENLAIDNYYLEQHNLGKFVIRKKLRTENSEVDVYVYL